MFCEVFNDCGWLLDGDEVSWLMLIVDGCVLKEVFWSGTPAKVSSNANSPFAD